MAIRVIFAAILLWSCLAGTAGAQRAPVQLRWLGEAAPTAATGVSWGVPWARGEVRPNQSFTLTAPDGARLPLQSWPLAYWPDGSVKWTGFATVAGPGAGTYTLSPAAARPAAAQAVVRVSESADAYEIDTGALRARIPRRGAALIESLVVDGRVVARDGRLVAIVQDGPDGEDLTGTPARTRFVSRVDSVRVEQSGPVRAVVRIRGMHGAEGGGRAWLPFDVRLYFHAGTEAVRLVHSIVYDGEQEKDFIRGLGLAFSVPMREQVQNRHVRFGAEGTGTWAEPIQPLTGRRPLVHQGRSVYPEQFAGRRVPNLEEYTPQGQTLLRNWAVWSDFKLVQGTADGFSIQKRTNPRSAWIDANAGTRASGLVFVGDVSGGLGVALRHFWQSHPASLEVRGAAGDAAELRVWLWSPDGPAMDMRHYDTVGHDLDASYEDWQPGFSTPYGVARTSELTLFPSGSVPTHEQSSAQARASGEPPLLVASPEHYHSVRAFGIWSLPDRSTPGKRWIEEQLDRGLAFYRKEVEQRRWYGFWNYGDVMHAYDPVRHAWRYDIGGYAWANTELAPETWLWYSFLRTGGAEVFRMAEAMTRHTSEVDVYHLGRFAGLGSRHNVRHWGDGSKEVRESQAVFKRFHHYLTTDERTGDLMREVANADLALLEVDPLRIAMPLSRFPSTMPTRARFGPDWISLAGNWMTEWERTGDRRWRDKIIAGMNSLVAMPHGLFSGPGVLGYDPATGRLVNEGPPDSEHTEHLAMIMGGAEMIFELNELIDHPRWREALLRYGELYSLPANDPSRTEADRGIGGGSFPGWHARLSAYVARETKRPELAARAWNDLLAIARTGQGGTPYFTSRMVEGPELPRPIEEIPWVSTNDVAQWSLNAIEVLELAGDRLPERHPLWDGAPPVP